MGRSLRRLALIFVAWTAAALFFLTQDLIRAAHFDDPTPWTRYLLSWLVGSWVMAALTPAILALGARFPIERRGWPRRVALHLVASAVVAFVSLAIVAALLLVAGSIGPLPAVSYAAALQLLLALSFHGNIVAYWLVLGIQQSLRVYRRAQQRETELVRAQLAALKLQVQPHFLYNTLNAIMVLVRQQRGREAEDTLGRLADLLRAVLDGGAAQEVALRRELAIVELYLDIEKLRFGDRLRVELAVDPEVEDAAVPPLALQPLVENAVRHGIGRRAAAGRLEIRAASDREQLVLSVTDDGAGPGGSSDGAGIGLASTRARLAQLYGGAASLGLAAAPGGGAVATLRLPYKLVHEDEPELMEMNAVHDAHR